MAYHDEEGVCGVSGEKRERERIVLKNTLKHRREIRSLVNLNKVL